MPRPFSRASLLAALTCLASIGLLANCQRPRPSDGTIYLGRDPSVMAKASSLDLVDAHKALPGVRIELRYAGRKNVLGKPLYPANMPCLIYRETAEKLRRAQLYLADRGLGLKIWDAWRPPSVQRRLWEESPEEGKEYIADPDKFWSQHCNGTAIDVTLVDFRGKEKRLPTDFDTFSPEAAFNYEGDDPEVRKNLKTLQRAMYMAGFYGLEVEWWHFNDWPNHAQPVAFAPELGITLPKRG